MNWSRQTLPELEATYWDTIAPALREAGHDPHERPTYETLVDLGFSGIAYALREHHDTTLGDFFDGIDLESQRGFAWDIGHEPTVSALETYVDVRRRRRMADSTADTVRSRLARYARTYAEVHDTTDLVGPVEDEADRLDGRRRALAVFDVLNDELSTDASKLKYLGDVRRWYEWLVDSGRAAYNPLRRAEKEFDWERSEPDNAALDAADVRTLHETASTPEQVLLVVGLAGWGLRPNELAALHASQLELSPEEGAPYLEFEERKNGPGTVSLLFGVDALERRIDELAVDDWGGYLFPSARSASGHLVTETVANRFESLAREAEVRVDGAVPTPKMGRRFWYATYATAQAEVLENLSAVAEEQGSSSARVVHRNYLSEDRRRELRRKHMRSALSDAFGGM
ncbi:site-specific integrase [Halobacterium zhouii]|uniref:site-specific integrase n=1 Tax=Halobacterium zhouii TaxID=2902624 RepID=UPI003D79B2F7